MGNLLRGFKAVSSLILSAVSVLGTAAVGVSSARAALKAKEKLDKSGDADILTAADKARITWKCYAVPVLIFAGTAACTIGSAVLNRKMQCSLAAAYALAAEGYRAYKSKVIDICGNETHERILEELGVVKADDTTITAVSMFNDTTLDFGSDDEERVVFYDKYSDRYFESTFGKVLQAEYRLNRNYALNGGRQTVNDFYRFLGIEPIEHGDDVAWDYGNEICWVDFNHYLTTLDDGMKIRVIEMPFEPEKIVDI